jgi:hypothetical protein
MGALLELLPDREVFLQKMNALHLPGVHLDALPSVRCGITGTHVRVSVDGQEEESLDDSDHGHSHEGPHPAHEHGHADPHHVHEHDPMHTDPHSFHENVHIHDSHHHIHENKNKDEDHSHHHSHASMAQLESLLHSLDLPPRVKEDALQVYALIAEAESRVHGVPVSRIHFHEVGTMDAVADVVGVCLLMHLLSPDCILASPVHVGSGHVHCMHGILPVPAPATALLLSGIPIYGGAVDGELCTPTGAALLRHFVRRFGDRPVMTCSAIGYGMGSKEFPRANCLRAFWGEGAQELEQIVHLECNLDDCTGEEIGFAMDQLFRAGARDVYTQPIGMKKSRPGVLLSVICMPEDADRLAGILLRHTTTLGVRRQIMSRYVLERTVRTVDTSYGPVRVKTASGMGINRSKAEYDDLAELALRHGVSLEDIRKELISNDP